MWRLRTFDDLNGCEIDPTVPRFGDKTPAAVKTHHENVATVNTTKQAGASIGGGISANSNNKITGKAEAKASASASQNRKVQSTSKQVVEAHDEPVVAMSGNRWRFSATATD